VIAIRMIERWAAGFAAGVARGLDAWRDPVAGGGQGHAAVVPMVRHGRAGAGHALRAAKGASAFVRRGRRSEFACALGT